MHRYTTLLLWLALAATNDAFVVPRNPASSTLALGRASAVVRPPFYMSADETQAETDAAEVNAENEDADEDQVTELTAEEQEPAEDPELVAMKEEIASLEAKIKEVRRQVMLTSDQADEFTKEGYARKVAEMEQMRRTRSRLNSSSRSAATANILQNFLPVLDRLEELGAKYSKDDFGKQYNALPGAMRSAMVDMGVSVLEVQPGETIDSYRMEVTASEHSETAPAQTVLRVETSGYELDGNVMRKPKVVASLGPELSLAASEQEESVEEADEAAEGEAADGASE